MVEVFHKRLHNLLPPIQKISQSYAEKGVPPFCKGDICKLAPYIHRARAAALKKASQRKSQPPQGSDAGLSSIGQEMMRKARNKSRRGGRRRGRVRGGRRRGGCLRHRKKRRRTRRRRRRL